MINQKLQQYIRDCTYQKFQIPKDVLQANVWLDIENTTTNIIESINMTELAQLIAIDCLVIIDHASNKCLSHNFLPEYPAYEDGINDQAMSSKHDIKQFFKI